MNDLATRSSVKKHQVRQELLALPDGMLETGSFHRSFPRRGAVRTRTVPEISALLRRTTDTAQVIRRVDKTDVGERLRAVSQLALEAGMVFLGKKPEVVAQR